MNEIVTGRSIRFGGASPLLVARPFHPVRVTDGLKIDPIRIHPILLPGLPLASTRIGNLFIDRNISTLHWYLPDFVFPDGIDASFAFAASQSGQQDASGDPFNAALVTMSLVKKRPADVDQFVAANPTADVREIPLAELSAVLTSFYVDDKGATQSRLMPAKLSESNGTVLLTFDSIVGPSVIGLYQDFKLSGKATISISGSYQAWSPPFTFPFLRFRAFQRTNIQPVKPPMFMVAEREPEILMIRPTTPVVAKPPPPPPPLVQTREVWQKVLPIAQRFNEDGYQLKYTVATLTTPARAIVSVEDLKAFSKRQSEFEELKALGNIQSKYPSLSRAYVGVLSRTIVVIPQRYSIIRGKSGCAAECSALVDSSPATSSKCKFEFDFAIAPEVSRVEFQKFVIEVASHPDLKTYRVQLPDFLAATPPSALQTSFTSVVQFAAGADPHTFALTVTVRDQNADTPAVANANLFITRLTSSSGADLIGSLSLKLDDNFTDSILATLDMNFLHTASTDELLVAVDEPSGTIKVTNQSPLDLQLSDYALIQGTTLNEFPGVVSIAANAFASFPLPVDHTGMFVAADCQLVVPQPMPKARVPDFLRIHTLDVQDTAYVVAIDGSGINYAKVDSVTATITFSNLPSVTPRALKLSKSVKADSTHVQVPLADAVFSLPSTVSLLVHFVDPAVLDLTVSLQQDFTASPLLLITQVDIDKAMPPVVPPPPVG